jgi:3D (Asp-Asp-Asp) domain-containing protein
MRVKTIFSVILMLMPVFTLVPAVQAAVPGASSKSCFSRLAVPSDSDGDSATTQGRLARITAYWPGEDYYTSRHRSATGVRLRDGYCAVDSRIIPYGSVVTIPGVGQYIAVDTGTAVISRKAAKESGHNPEERSALVIDLYFASRRAGELFSRVGPKFAMIAWQMGG